MHMLRIALMGTVLLTVAPVSAADDSIINGFAPANWQTQSRENGVPAPAPLVIYNGVTYRLGDPGVQFARHDDGGVLVVLGSCEFAENRRIIASEVSQSGASSVIVDCDMTDDNHGAVAQAN